MVRFGFEDGKETDNDQIKKLLEERGADGFQSTVISTLDAEITVYDESSSYAVSIDGDDYDTFSEAIDDHYDGREAEEVAGVTRDRRPGDPMTDGGTTVYDDETGEDRLYDVPELSEDAQRILDSMTQEE
ncbi:hypothetical protein [Candidatus Nanohalobium constans]|uniref:Uncharacterized protein n=1 Tax=Candidatus Nanohalobium constans TaxID=2565781 RepID=A0A5Q0UG75_9ARCH|nr:hypothetical protein [Candidatus Nanohalobium constans]QGA79989.1 hypothetical protein LC1Nh_0081 [Candidatus Nanohalobium constans]